MKDEKRYVAILILTLALTAGCRGGGGAPASSSGGVNMAPVANAGPNQNVATGSTVFLGGLAGSDADGDSRGF